jgi:hypothetical protein
MIRPNGSATKDCPQNVSAPSWPTRLTAATKTPLAIAWARWMVSHAECCARFISWVSDGSQPIAVG